jgi:hypothetical protein
MDASHDIKVLFIIVNAALQSSPWTSRAPRRRRRHNSERPRARFDSQVYHGDHRDTERETS